MVEVARPNATATNVEQRFYSVSTDDKRAAVLKLLKERSLGQALVFVNSKLGCARLARAFERDGLRTNALHGDKSQDERLKALAAFKAGEVDVLVATDVAARGLDIVDLPGVFNYDVPFNAEDYVHRIGRTGRAGASGLAMTLVTREDNRLVADIEKLIKNKIELEPLELDDDRPRRDFRAERRRSFDDDEREPRARPRNGSFAPSVPKAPVDPFFERPYEASSTMSPAWKAPLPRLRRVPARHQGQAQGRCAFGAKRPPNDRHQPARKLNTAGTSFSIAVGAARQAATGSVRVSVRQGQPAAHRQAGGWLQRREQARQHRFVAIQRLDHDLCLRGATDSVQFAHPRRTLGRVHRQVADRQSSGRSGRSPQRQHQWLEPASDTVILCACAACTSATPGSATAGRPPRAEVLAVQRWRQQRFHDGHRRGVRAFLRPRQFDDLDGLQGPRQWHHRVDPLQERACRLGVLRDPMP
jgi:hypothetical protein